MKQETLVRFSNVSYKMELRVSEVGHNVGGDDDINCILNILCNYFACQFFSPHKSRDVIFGQVSKNLNCWRLSYYYLSSMVGSKY